MSHSQGCVRKGNLCQRCVTTRDCEILQSLLKGWYNFLEMTQQQQILKFATKQGCSTVLYVHTGYAHFFNQPLKPCKLENPARSDRLQICLFVYSIHQISDTHYLYPDLKMKGRKKLTQSLHVQSALSNLRKSNRQGFKTKVKKRFPSGISLLFY